MYIPKDNRVSLATAQALLGRYDFGALVSVEGGVPTATHLPFLYRPEGGPLGTVSAHLARANPQAKALESSPTVLLVAQGPHGYISPSWYAVHPSVPTWNYVAVHVTGRARVVSDPTRVRTLLGTLVDRYESGRKNPWTMALPETYLQGMLRQIVAFDIDITLIEGKLKLSQNRTAEEQESVIRGLEESQDPLAKELAAAMREHRGST
ncbi:MAG TPA: FMN-binding negative transcriptional regulator [Planctomycetota bacterium]|nr:FMN-binding negative transcriptional regulator [Planctomycetota bacterium]